LAVKTSIQVQNLNFNLALDEALSPEARQKVFAAQATEIVDDVKAQNARILGRVPPHTISVDGRMGAPISSARTVVYVEFEFMFELLEWIGQMLEQHSPVRTGRYQKSHMLLADGVAVSPGQAPPLADRYEFVNVQPYARKIERGLSPKRPDGVYQSVAKLASSTSRWGNVARVKFGYVTPLFGPVSAWANKSKGARGRRRAEWLSRQPAIIVTL